MLLLVGKFLQNFEKHLDTLLQVKHVNFSEMEDLYSKVRGFLRDYSNIEEKDTFAFVRCAVKYIECINYYLDRSGQNDCAIKHYCDVIGVIPKLPEIRLRYLQEISKTILEKVTDLIVPIRFAKELLANFNRALQYYNKELLHEFIPNELFSLCRLADTLNVCGDYGYQVTILETIFYMCSAKQIIEYSSLFFPASETLQNAFKMIHQENFNFHVRVFLNVINRKSNLVVSVKCELVSLDNIYVDAPKGCEDSELWVDFNTGSDSISIFCDVDSLRTSLSCSESSNNDAWELITVNAADVQNVIVSRLLDEDFSTSRGSIICFNLAKPCSILFGSSKQAANAKLLKLVILCCDALLQLENDILPKLFNGKFKRMPQPPLPHQQQRILIGTSSRQCVDEAQRSRNCNNLQEYNDNSMTFKSSPQERIGNSLFLDETRSESLPNPQLKHGTKSNHSRVVLIGSHIPPLDEEIFVITDDESTIEQKEEDQQSVASTHLTNHVIANIDLTLDDNEERNVASQAFIQSPQNNSGTATCVYSEQYYSIPESNTVAAVVGLDLTLDGNAGQNLISQAFIESTQNSNRTATHVYSEQYYSIPVNNTVAAVVDLTYDDDDDYNEPTYLQSNKVNSQYFTADYGHLVGYSNTSQCYLEPVVTTNKPLEKLLTIMEEDEHAELPVEVNEVVGHVENKSVDNEMVQNQPLEMHPEIVPAIIHKDQTKRILVSVGKRCENIREQSPKKNVRDRSPKKNVRGKSPKKNVRDRSPKKKTVTTKTKLSNGNPYKTTKQLGKVIENKLNNHASDDTATSENIIAKLLEGYDEVTPEPLNKKEFEKKTSQEDRVHVGSSELTDKQSSKTSSQSKRAPRKQSKTKTVTRVEVSIADVRNLSTISRQPVVMLEKICEMGVDQENRTEIDSINLATNKETTETSTQSEKPSEKIYETNKNLEEGNNIEQVQKGVVETIEDQVLDLEREEENVQNETLLLEKSQNNFRAKKMQPKITEYFSKKVGSTLRQKLHQPVKKFGSHGQNLRYKIKDISTKLLVSTGEEIEKKSHDNVLVHGTLDIEAESTGKDCQEKSSEFRDHSRIEIQPSIKNVEDKHDELPKRFEEQQIQEKSADMEQNHGEEKLKRPPKLNGSGLNGDRCNEDDFFEPSINLEKELSINEDLKEEQMQTKKASAETTLKAYPLYQRKTTHKHLHEPSMNAVKEISEVDDQSYHLVEQETILKAYPSHQRQTTHVHFLEPLMNVEEELSRGDDQSYHSEEKPNEPKTSGSRRRDQFDYAQQSSRDDPVITEEVKLRKKVVEKGETKPPKEKQMEPKDGKSGQRKVENSELVQESHQDKFVHDLVGSIKTKLDQNKGNREIQSISTVGKKTKDAKKSHSHNTSESQVSADLEKRVKNKILFDINNSRRNPVVKVKRLNVLKDEKTGMYYLDNAQNYSAMGRFEKDKMTYRKTNFKHLEMGKKKSYTTQKNKDISNVILAQKIGDDGNNTKGQSNTNDGHQKQMNPAEEEEEEKAILGDHQRQLNAEEEEQNAISGGGQEQLNTEEGQEQLITKEKQVTFGDYQIQSTIEEDFQNLNISFSSTPNVPEENQIKLTPKYDVNTEIIISQSRPYSSNRKRNHVEIEEKENIKPAKKQKRPNTRKLFDPNNLSFTKLFTETDLEEKTSVYLKPAVEEPKKQNETKKAKSVNRDTTKVKMPKKANRKNGKNARGNLVPQDGYTKEAPTNKNTFSWKLKERARAQEDKTVDSDEENKDGRRLGNKKQIAPAGECGEVLTRQQNKGRKAKKKKDGAAVTNITRKRKEKQSEEDEDNLDSFDKILTKEERDKSRELVQSKTRKLARLSRELTKSRRESWYSGTNLSNRTLASRVNLDFLSIMNSFMESSKHCNTNTTLNTTVSKKRPKRTRKETAYKTRSKNRKLYHIDATMRHEDPQNGYESLYSDEGSLKLPTKRKKSFEKIVKKPKRKYTKTVPISSKVPVGVTKQNSDSSSPLPELCIEVERELPRIEPELRLSDSNSPLQKTPIEPVKPPPKVKILSNVVLKAASNNNLENSGPTVMNNKEPSFVNSSVLPVEAQSSSNKTIELEPLPRGQTSEILEVQSTNDRDSNKISTKSSQKKKSVQEKPFCRLPAIRELPSFSHNVEINTPSAVATEDEFIGTSTALVRPTYEEIYNWVATGISGDAAEVVKNTLEVVMRSYKDMIAALLQSVHGPVPSELIDLYEMLTKLDNDFNNYFNHN